MRKNSLSYRYKKALREHSNATNEEKRQIKYNYITKLFLRIFLSTLILLGLIIMNKITFTKKGYLFSERTIEKNWNFLNLVTTINALFGEFIIIEDDVMVDSSTLYDEVVFENEINVIKNYSFSGVTSAASGVVTKIIKDNNDLYTITIQSNDDYFYTYSNLESIDYSIYSYVGKGEIIGVAQNQNSFYTFELKIEKEGTSYSFYEEN